MLFHLVETEGTADRSRTITALAKDTAWPMPRLQRALDILVQRKHVTVSVVNFYDEEPATRATDIQVLPSGRDRHERWEGEMTNATDDQIRVLRELQRREAAHEHSPSDTDLASSFSWDEAHTKGVVIALEKRGEVKAIKAFTTGLGGYSFMRVSLTGEGHKRIDATEPKPAQQNIDMRGAKVTVKGGSQFAPGSPGATSNYRREAHVDTRVSASVTGPKDSWWRRLFGRREG